MSALRERQPDLHDRLLDVAGRALQLAEALGMSAEQRDEVLRAAELHDTGKMAIPMRSSLSPARWSRRSGISFASTR